MRILFVYSVQKSILQNKPLLGQENIYFGISQLSSVLKQHGHSCELVVLDRRYGTKNIDLLDKRITSFSPQILSFTAVFSEFEFIYDIASQLKRRYSDLFFYAGGVHLTLNPDEKYLDVFDAFCVGEGEYPTLELVDGLEKGEDISNIANLWVKTKAGIKKNPERAYISDLDSLPPADREMWQEWILEPQTKLTVLIGRGCPFNCTYCCNHKLRKISPGKYVRMRSPENILEEIQQLHISYPDTNEIYLEVETLGVNIKWLEHFCELMYQFGINTGFKIKFGTNLRIFPTLDVDAVFKNFKKANITSVTIGLESGSYRIRKEILNRDYSNELILQVAELAKSYGIELALFNMVGLPTETWEDFQETLKMNQVIQPAFHATSIFFPYPGTDIYDTCKDLGLLPESINTKDERQIAVMDMPGFSRKQIEKGFNSFHYNVYKMKPGASKIKLFIYYLMSFVGHNTFANMKISLIRIMYKVRVINVVGGNFFSIFQKSK